MFNKLFYKRPYLVWHDKENETKIVVFRNWFQMKMYSNHISKQETDYSFEDLGCAIDLTLVELKTGKEIPMPTEFDDFSEKANPNYKNLSDTIIKNRTFLFSIMNHFGFSYYASEWWHFDYAAWRSYPLLNVPFHEL